MEPLGWGQYLSAVPQLPAPSLGQQLECWAALWKDPPWPDAFQRLSQQAIPSGITDALHTCSACLQVASKPQCLIIGACMPNTTDHRSYVMLCMHSLGKQTTPGGVEGSITHSSTVAAGRTRPCACNHTCNHQRMNALWNAVGLQHSSRTAPQSPRNRSCSSTPVRKCRARQYRTALLRKAAIQPFLRGVFPPNPNKTLNCGLVPRGRP